MQSKATTVSEYLKELPPDRRAAISQLRKIIRQNLPKGFQEGMQYGMIGYFVPHRLYPDGYHCDPKQPLPYVSLASQKNHMAIYLCAAYSDKQESGWFQRAWKDSGKKLNMGKSCVRFKKLDDVPLDVVAAAVRRLSVQEFIELYESVIKPPGHTESRPSKQLNQKQPAATKTRTSKSTQTPPTMKKKKAAKKKQVPAKKSTKKKVTSRSNASKGTTARATKKAKKKASAKKPKSAVKKGKTSPTKRSNTKSTRSGTSRKKTQKKSSVRLKKSKRPSK